MRRQAHTWRAGWANMRTLQASLRQQPRLGGPHRGQSTGIFPEAVAPAVASTCGLAAPTAACPPTRSSDLPPGELFVHRNVANSRGAHGPQLPHRAAVRGRSPKVKHVLVGGHYGCGGVASAVRNDRPGLIDNWLRHVQDVPLKHLPMMQNLAGPNQQSDRLCGTQHHRAGGQCLPDHRGPGSLGPRPGRGHPRLDLQPGRRPPAGIARLHCWPG